MFLKKLLIVLFLIIISTIQTKGQLIYELDDFVSQEMGFTFFESSRFFSSSATGDINGDGLDDLIFSSSNNVYVIFGDENRNDTKINHSNFSSDLDGTIGFRVTGIFNDTDLGVSLASPDINNDGFHEVVIGLAGAGTSNEGKLHLIYGKAGSFESDFDAHFYLGISKSITLNIGLFTEIGTRGILGLYYNF